MTDTDVYIDAVVQRLRSWDANVYQARVGPLTATVGDFYRVSVQQDISAPGHHTPMYNIELHHAVVVAALPSVDGAWVVQDFTRRANDLAYATARMPTRFHMLHAGIGVLVTHHVHPSAIPATGVRGLSHPVIVDLSTGWVYCSFPRRMRALFSLFPLPAELGIIPTARPANPADGWDLPPAPPP